MTETRKILDLLCRFESRNITFIEQDGSWPIVWARAKNDVVWDVDGRAYVDLTAGFGVANAGHANRRVVRAAKLQLERLPHAMGDVHPHPLKAELAQTLSRITFERWAKDQHGKTIFCNSGFEAVEAALKTAMLATGRSGVVVFEGAYHGLGYGALTVTHRELFRAPFIKQLGGFARFVPYPIPRNAATKDKNFNGQSDLQVLEKTMNTIDRIHRKHGIGAVLVEPVQGRGGIRVPVPGFLPALRSWCDDTGTLLIFDEIYTGFGRTGSWFACEHEKVIPDLICLGKALTGGFPLSACVGKADLMDTAWPKSKGEAIHTSTFLGNPVGCAMALAQVKELESRGLVRRSAELGGALMRWLENVIQPRSIHVCVRGAGLMIGVELRKHNGSPATTEAAATVKAMLRRGYIMLTEGESCNVLAFTPPLTINTTHLKGAVETLGEIMSQWT